MNADQTPSNPARRRLTRGGLAVPVVLASLASRNAFAVTPYNCTISGQLSGNMSPLGPNKNPDGSCSLLAGRSEVLSTLKSDQSTFESVFSTAYFANGTNDKADTLSGAAFQPPSQAATLYQVLNLSNYTSGMGAPKEPDFAKMAVVLYQNAGQGPSDLYPLTKPQVVAMFNAALKNLDYNGSTSMGAFTWTPKDVRAYFGQLYH